MIMIKCKFTILSTQAEGMLTKILILPQRPDLVLKCSISRSLSRRDKIKTFNCQAKPMMLCLGEIKTTFSSLGRTITSPKASTQISMQTNYRRAVMTQSSGRRPGSTRGSCRLWRVGQPPSPSYLPAVWSHLQRLVEPDSNSRAVYQLWPGEGRTITEKWSCPR